MAIKDNFVGLYIRRFVIPGALVFNKPGFVDFKISGKTSIYARQIFYPEDFFVKFESRIVGAFGDEGRKQLYSIGKKFGYRFAQSGKFENVSNNPGDKIKKWISIVSKFVEGTYASLIENTTDVSLKKTDFTLKNFTVLEELGYEYIFATGGTAGLMAWMFQDPTIEVVLHDVKGNKGNYDGVVTSAPFNYLNSHFKDQLIFSETNLDGLSEEFQNYVSFNQHAEIMHKKSFQSYLDFNFFKYQKGIITFNNNRFFLFETSGTYLIEYELLKSKKKKYLDILFGAAFDTGYETMSQFGSNLNEVFEVLSALGWGEVLQFSSAGNQIKISINHFPWSKWYDDIDFLMVRGFLSGIVSKINKKKMLFEKPVIDLSKGSLSLLFGGKYV
ncbi:MAG: hypothetical protein HON47_00380 [Candidatus Diapherotrites archaeon]|jgi:hypothetical protein|uniref:Uncharacterized protein n=1 Tax=Candidatus Iainarchaeum sp. TaxID=3101447 RepID=A0A8T5GEQ1_9ARCH|nr:hypothetical protein [Candidatus Diapherotrites archaeon]